MLEPDDMAAGEGTKTGIGARIAIARKRANLSQVDLNRELGVKGQVPRWEAETNTPSLDQLIRIAQLGKVREAWLITGELPMVGAGEIRVVPGPDAPHVAHAVAEYLDSPRGQRWPDHVKQALREGVAFHHLGLHRPEWDDIDLVAQLLARKQTQDVTAEHPDLEAEGYTPLKPKKR